MAVQDAEQAVPGGTSVEPWLDHMRDLVQHGNVLPEDVFTAYEAMVLDADRRTPEGHSRRRRLSLPFDDGLALAHTRELLNELQESGLITQYPEQDEPYIEIAHPWIALITTLDRAFTQLQKQTTAIQAAQIGIQTHNAEMLVSLDLGAEIAGSGVEDGAGLDGRQFEIIKDPNRIRDLTGDFALAMKAQKQFCEFSKIATDRQLSPGMARPVPPSRRKGSVSFRAVYEGMALGDETWQAGTRQCIESGEQARIYRDPLPLKAKIVDGGTTSSGKVALVALTATGANEAMLVRNPFWVDLLQLTFDLVWDRAVPIVIDDDGRLIERPVPDADDLEPIQQQIIALMYLKGVTDNQLVADLKALGFDREKHTIQRYRNSLKDLVGAKTHFQLAVEAERRGWVPRGNS